MDSSSGLTRFTEAQKNTYAAALAEIKAGKKKSHWMWFIFPQIAGLGFSEMSVRYGIRNMAEAVAYLQHPLLGPRLVEISRELLKLNSTDAFKIFGSPDDMKLKSSMTLFESSENADPVFSGVLKKFFHGSRDEKTLQLLNRN